MAIGVKERCRTERDQGSDRRVAGHSRGNAGLKPSNAVGAGYFLLASLVSGGGVALALSGNLALWLAGQLCVALAFTQWFCLLHECAHRTLFRSRLPNLLVGQVAGFFSLIPFTSWKRVHALHHRWTGWQDVDPTTEQLAHKPTSRVLLGLANFCWRWWIPLFSVVYRLENYWHLPRLRRRFRGSGASRGIVLNAVGLLIVYAVVVFLVGPGRVLEFVGLGLLGGLIFQDIFLLSQHTHIPQNVSEGREVRPFPPAEQEVFTRSLRFPSWFSRLVLVEADAHELHHVYPFLPGYRLHCLPDETGNEMHWLRWTLAVRRIPAETFLYQNRNETGFDI